MKNTHKKVKLTKQEKKEILNKGEKFITKQLSKQLQRFIEKNKKTDHINHKIFHLLHDPFVFVNAYAKISKNAGALSPGQEDSEEMKYFGLEIATRIANRIKNGRYKFKPVKRSWVPKPGKKTKRPIGVPTQVDRIVQEAVRGILEAVYEPVFQEFAKKTYQHSNNYGFRPKHSVWMAIETLKKLTQKCNIIIEGDIVSAYNNIEHKLLMEILRKRITDKKFLKLIKDMLKSGIMDQGAYEHSLKGTPQGGIVSPLLFNIYMLGLDEFVYEEFIKATFIENQETNKTKKNTESKEYSKVRRKLTKLINQLQELKKNDPENREEIKAVYKEFKAVRAHRNTIPSGKIEKLEKKAVYVRYADDWVLAITGTKKEAQQIKERITDYLRIHRKMELDEEKTKITHASDGYKFLGFEIRLRTSKPKLARVLMKNKRTNKYTRPLRRTTSRKITIEPDNDKIFKRLVAQGFCTKDGEPRGKAAWTVYDEFQIVQKFSQVFFGLYVYYEPCGRLSRLTRASYICQYSCGKTLAKRKKTSLRNIFEMYTKKLVVTRAIQGTKKTETKKVYFPELTDLRKWKINRNNDELEPMDPFRIREFWRTKFKFYNECCICGSTKNVALHHNNSLRKIKPNQKDKFETIRSQTNRLQIPVCQKCHDDITHGKYNNPKSPIEFYNEFLAKL